MLLTIVILCGSIVWSDEPSGPRIASIKEVRPLLNSDVIQDRMELMFLNASAFPSYIEILKAKDVTYQEQERILMLLANLKTDRKSFLRPTVELLSSKSPDVRFAALILLAEIGEPQNCAPLIVFLGVKDKKTNYQAAKTMTAIGNERTVLAFNFYLAHGNHENNEEILKQIRKYRDELKARLAKEKK